MTVTGTENLLCWNYQTLWSYLSFGLTMTLVSVCICGEWLRVPRGKSSASVHELATGALRRFYQTKVDKDGGRKKRFSVHKCTGEILLPDDNVEEVLQENDFVHLGMRGLNTWDVLISDLKFPKIHWRYLCFLKSSLEIWADTTFLYLQWDSILFILVKTREKMHIIVV